MQISLSNRCKDLFKRMKYFGFSCTLRLQAFYMVSEQRVSNKAQGGQQFLHQGSSSCVGSFSADFNDFLCKLALALRPSWQPLAPKTSCLDLSPPLTPLTSSLGPSHPLTRCHPSQYPSDPCPNDIIPETM